MIEEYFHIRDNCRNGLIKYLQEALSVLPVIKNPEILDIGCGTGVPALWLAGKYAGRITAIDIDRDSLGWLQKKIDEKILGDRITVLNLSFFDFKTQPDYYDLILSEGFLNVVGFKKGFQRAINILKKKGFFIIHDEFKDHPWKCNFIRDNGCGIIDTLFLDEQVWWNDYYFVM